MNNKTTFKYTDLILKSTYHHVTFQAEKICANKFHFMIITILQMHEKNNERINDYKLNQRVMLYFSKHPLNKNNITKKM